MALPEHVKELTDSERLERLERAIITLCEITDERGQRFDDFLNKAEAVLKMIEAEGPAAFLGTLMGGRRRRRRGGSDE